MQISFSLHKINNENKFSFNPSDYSKFKFGDDLISENYGISLAKKFIEQHLTSIQTIGQIVVISSPYAFIPTATFSLKTFFIYELNNWLSEQGFPVVQETKIHRTITYKEDYGELNAEERIKLIGQDSFHIDKQFLQNKILIFLDDIRITGSHEKMINKMIQEYDLTNHTYLLYFAELVNKNIHPNIENYLNYFYVKSVFDLDNIIKSDRFTINTRIVKYILNVDSSSLKIFIQNQTSNFLSLLYNMAIGNNYHNIDAYKENLCILKFQIEELNKSNSVTV